MEQTIDVADSEQVQRVSLSRDLRDVSSGEDIPAGRYLLTLRIEDCGLGCSPAASRTICVVSSE